VQSKISVVIPSLGRVSVLSTIASLSRQTILPSEIIVVLNSSKNTEKVKLLLKNLNRSVRIIYEKRKGASFARNTGMKAAKYSLLFFIDDDCIAKPNWIEESLRYYKKHHPSAVKGHNIHTDTNNIYSLMEYYQNEYITKASLFNTNGVIYTSLLDTKNLFLDKEIIMKNKIFFDGRYINSSYEDIDFGRQLLTRKIDIHYNPQMIVDHSGRTLFIQHMFREFNKGRNIYLFKKKWNKLNKIIDGYQNRLKYRFLFEANRTKKNKIEAILKKRLLGSKSWSYNLLFYIILSLSKIGVWIGYYYMKFCSSK